MAKSVQWFPGHMKKGLRLIGEQIKMVDLIFETCDARIPKSSRNLELNQVLQNKPRILVLNKADLADPAKTIIWQQYWQEKNISAIACDANHKQGLDKLVHKSLEITSDILEKAKAKGRIGRGVRVMVVGIPNSGKSTLINALCNRKVAITGDRPGVTKGYQWARTAHQLELMDMPGILAPKLDQRTQQLALALTGAVKLETLDQIEIAVEGIHLLLKLYPKEMFARYLLEKDKIDFYLENPYEFFLESAKGKGCILSGGRINEERFAGLFLEDLRSGRIGKISLELPNAGVEGSL